MSQHPTRCERNMAGREEDCGRHVAYVPCGEPAHWCVEDGDRAWWACEAHTMEALRESDSLAVTGEIDGEPVELDADGEIVKAA